MKPWPQIRRQLWEDIKEGGRTLLALPLLLIVSAVIWAAFLFIFTGEWIELLP